MTHPPHIKPPPTKNAKPSHLPHHHHQQQKTRKLKKTRIAIALSAAPPPIQIPPSSSSPITTMSCTVAVSNSSPFSPSSAVSSPHFRRSPFSHPLSRVSSSSPRVWQADSEDGDGPPTISIACPTPFSSASALLKRKRPARLDIPISPAGFGFPLATQAEDSAVVEAERDGVYSVCCKRGRRGAMEDRYSAVLDIHGDPKQAFFGVFDGHGGAKAAEFAADNMEKNIMDEITSRGGGGDGDDVVEEAVRNGYLKTDSDFLKEDAGGGSCCVTALIRDGNLVVSNAGDCRAVTSRGGVAEALTDDHRPSREDEKRRIEAMGGYIDCYNGIWRIQACMAVSRSIGDRHLKQWVVAEPETRIQKIESDYEFLILASDGLWDKVSNQEAVDVARPLCVGAGEPEPLAACKRLIEISVSRGSCDDISVMLIQLDKYRGAAS